MSNSKIYFNGPTQLKGIGLLTWSVGGPCLILPRIIDKKLIIEEDPIGKTPLGRPLLW